MNCLFCNIAQNEKERMTIYEDERLVFIMDKFVDYPQYCSLL